MADKPTTKAELLERIHSSYAALEQTIGQLKDDQMTTPIDGSWSAKDLLAHIAAWQQVMLQFHIGRKPFEQVTGLDDVPYASTSVDQINEAFYARDKDLPLAEALQTFRTGHKQLLATLDTLSDADLKKHYTPSGSTNGGPLIDWVGGDSYDHYEEHCETLRRLL